MTFFKELNFPCPVQLTKLIVEINALKRAEQTYTTILTQPQNYLHPDLVDTFKSIELNPQFIAVFGRPDSHTGLSLLHTDLIVNDKNWVRSPCGINWDLTIGEATFNWWDVGNCQEVYPDMPPKSDFPPQVNGIHYKERGNKNTTGFQLIESYKIKLNQPVLFRTDVPHQISYTTSAKQRLSISVRFSMLEIPTWERGLEIFQPFFKYQPADNS